jgi:hypothetical protein
VLLMVFFSLRRYEAVTCMLLFIFFFSMH